MINKIINQYKKLPSHPLTVKLLEWSKRYPLPGSGNIPIYDIGKFIYEETKKDNLTTRSNSIAFSIFLAIFPFVIFLFTLLPYLPFTEDYSLAISNATQNFLPHSAHSYLMNVIEDITKIKRGGLLSIGFILALYFSSGGMLTLMRGFDKSHKVSFKNRNFIYKRGIALLLTFLLTMLFILSIGLIILGDFASNYLSTFFQNNALANYVLIFCRWLIAVCMLYFGINILYHFGPSLRRKLPFINPGSIVASVLSLLTSLGFAFFVNNFGRYNELYGSIGALIVILLWFKINAFILLVGFELNAGIAVNRDLKNQYLSEKS